MKDTTVHNSYYPSERYKQVLDKTLQLLVRVVKLVFLFAPELSPERMRMHDERYSRARYHAGPTSSSV